LTCPKTKDSLQYLTSITTPFLESCTKLLGRDNNMLSLTLIPGTTDSIVENRKVDFLKDLCWFPCKDGDDDDV
jgi:hypothetical protein